MFGIAVTYFGTTMLLLAMWMFYLWEERYKLAAALCGVLSLFGAISIGYTASLWLG